MKRRFVVLAAGVLMSLFVAGLAPVASAQSSDTQNFTINSFTANYYLDRQADGVPTMKVDEVIVAEFPQFDQNHGIYRYIPQDYKKQPLSIKLQTITNEVDVPYRYTTSQSNGNLVITIGDPNHFVHGVNTYHIIYTLQNPVSFDAQDELYWNVNGTHWQQPIDRAEANIHIPSKLVGQLQEQKLCFTGSQDSKASDCLVTDASTKTEKIVSVTNLTTLPPGNNLTFVLGFTKGTFAIDKAAQRARKLRLIGQIAAVAVPPFLVIILLVTQWWRHGRDPKGRGTIVPQYTPPKELNSLTSDVIMKEGLRNSAVTALIIELAIRGLITISETNKVDYQLTLVRVPDDLSSDEKAVIDLCFAIPTQGTTIKVSQPPASLRASFAKLTKSLPAQLTTAGYFVKDPAKVVANYRIAGSVVGAFGLFLALAGGSHSTWRLVGVGTFVGSMIMTSFASVMSARTEKGVATREYLLGLRDFIKVAEADRIRYLQSPAGVRQWGDPSDPQTKIKLFEKLLPYAMIFGIEKDWAAAFQNIYTTPPDWYRGNWTSFNTGYLIGSLNGFGSASAAAFAPPSSSSSSGFGGGGFSGGGGGGGGGGGW